MAEPAIGDLERRAADAENRLRDAMRAIGQLISAGRQEASALAKRDYRGEIKDDYIMETDMVRALRDFIQGMRDFLLIIRDLEIIERKEGRAAKSTHDRFKGVVESEINTLVSTARSIGKIEGAI